MLIAGVDEAGRGPLAGPVVVAAVMLDPGRESIPGLADSKRLAPARREQLAQRIRSCALAMAVITVDTDEIERLNILGATLLGMERAVAALDPSPQRVLIDGDRGPQLPMDSACMVGGDGRVAAISAASIVAKVERDRLMCELDRRYPGYGFGRHKGYGTRDHLDALARLGPCPVHRADYAPVRAARDQLRLDL